MWGDRPGTGHRGAVDVPYAPCLGIRPEDTRVDSESKPSSLPFYLPPPLSAIVDGVTLTSSGSILKREGRSRDVRSGVAGTEYEPTSFLSGLQ